MLNQLSHRTTSSCRLLFITIFLLIFIVLPITGCLVSDPDFKPYDRDAILASERRVIIQLAPTAIPIKQKISR